MAGATVRVISGNFLTARPVGIVDGVDFQHSGLVRKVDVAGIQRTLDMGALVLLSPFGFPHGRGVQPEHGRSSHQRCDRIAGRQADFPHGSPGIRMQPTEPESEDNPIDTELPLAAAQALLAKLPPAQHRPTRAFTCSTA